MRLPELKKFIRNKRGRDIPKYHWIRLSEKRSWSTWKKIYRFACFLELNEKVSSIEEIKAALEFVKETNGAHFTVVDNFRVNINSYDRLILRVVLVEISDEDMASFFVLSWV